MGCLQVSELFGAKTPEKIPQGTAVREVGQAQDGWNKPIVDQALSVLDPADTGYDGKDMSQEEVHGMILSVMVIGPANVELEEVAEARRFAKLLKKTQSAKAGQTRSLEGKMEFSWSLGHTSQMHKNGALMKSPFYHRETRYP